MRLRSLKHVVETVQSLLHPRRITVLGSSSLLAKHPELGEKGNVLELSLDADLLVEPCDENKAGVVHEAVGENSLFHREFGVYVDLLKPDIEETLPDGWRKRCVMLGRHSVVACLHPLDLAFVKLTVGREKDMGLLRILIKKKIVDLHGVRKLYQGARMDEKTLFKAGRNLRQLEIDEEGTSADVLKVVRKTKSIYKVGMKRKAGKS